MSDLNCAIVRGRLTRNAELKYVSNLTICNFSIACNYAKKDTNTGTWSTIPDFFDCVVFGAYAEAMAPHLTKGKPVIVQARLKQERWQSNGENKSKITLVCSSIEFLPQGKKTENTGEPETEPDFDSEQPPEKIPF